MTDAYLHSLLGEHEQVLLETRQHWFVLVRAILAESLLMIAIITLVILLMTFWYPDPMVALGLLLLLLPAISMTHDILVWTNRKFIVTNRRVIQISGVINKNVIDSSLEKVNDVKMEQSLLGRTFNYGDIEILTASELGVNRFSLIGDPIHFKTAMINAKAKLDNGEGLHSLPPANDDIPSLIALLGNLRDKGVLSEEEFQKKKSDLLTRI